MEAAIAQLLEDLIPPAAATDYLEVARRVLRLRAEHRPSFPADTIVHGRAFVVDVDGEGWWIDSDTSTIKAALSG